MNDDAVGRRALNYTVVDVFADRALEGNPLAVFHDATGLTTEQMQAIARELNLSETAFVLPEEGAGEAMRVRIFTVREELPFAGHPTLGTASWLHLAGPEATRGRDCVTLQLGVGPIPVRFDGMADGQWAEGRMRQRDPEFGERFDLAEVALALGMEVGDLLPGAIPQAVSTGNWFCVVVLRSVEVLSRLEISQREATAWLRERGLRWFYVIAPEDEGGLRWRARMQFYGGEDPATGSAAGPAIAWLVREGRVPSGVEAEIRQGVEMGRPSRIWVSARVDQSKLGQPNLGRVTDVFVGGRTIPVATGRLFLPVES